MKGCLVDCLCVLVLLACWCFPEPLSAAIAMMILIRWCKRYGREEREEKKEESCTTTQNTGA